MGAYVDVLLEDDTDISNFNVTIRYTNESDDEKNYIVYWCGTDGNWQQVAGATIDIDEGGNKAVFTLTSATTPSLSQLEGTPFVVADSTPLAVTLSYFHAQANGETVDFAWQTATETGTAGFNLLAVTDAGKVQLNDALIASPVIDSVEPTDYRFEAVTGATQFYVQQVAIGGRVTEHGPFELGGEYGSASGTNDSGTTDDEMTQRIWLPMVAAGE